MKIKINASLYPIIYKQAIQTEIKLFKEQRTLHTLKKGFEKLSSDNDIWYLYY